MRPRRLPFSVAIGAALLLKAVLLYALWRAFFSAPQAPHMRMPSAAVAAHLITPPARTQHDAH
jgi:hypothetical protein